MEFNSRFNGRTNPEDQFHRLMAEDPIKGGGKRPRMDEPNIGIDSTTVEVETRTQGFLGPLAAR